MCAETQLERETGTGTDEVAGSFPDAVERDLQAEQLHAQARISDLFTSVPGNQKLFLDTMGECRESKTPAQLDEFMRGILATNRSVMRPVELRAALENHGAIEYLPSDEEDAARGRLLPDGSIDENEPVEVDDEGFLVMHVPEQGKWRLSAAGALFLDADPLGAYADGLLARESRYTAVYRTVLGMLAEKPSAHAELAAVADKMPECQQPRVWVGHFLGELEHAGAIAWEDIWKITERGKTLLGKLRAEGDADSGADGDSEEGE